MSAVPSTGDQLRETQEHQMAMLPAEGTDNMHIGDRVDTRAPSGRSPVGGLAEGTGFV